MRTTFVSALAALLFAASVIAAPAADAEVDHALEKRQHWVTVTVHRPNVNVATQTVKYLHTVTQYVQATPQAPPPPPPPPAAPQADSYQSSSGNSGSGSDSSDDSSDDSSSSSSSSDSSADSSAPDADAQTVLDSHNQYRSLHSAPDLTWSASLASYAASNAASCVFAHTDGPYGENLAAGYGSIADSIEAWYEEISGYDFNNPGYSDSTGHFTQVVWVASTEVGCAWVNCNGENGTPGYYLMCEYSPAGNVIGSFPENVLEN